MPFCLCGSPLCRGKVTPQDYLLEELQERYAGYFISYLRDRIAASKNTLLEKNPETSQLNETPMKEPVINIDLEPFEQFVDFRDHAS